MAMPVIVKILPTDGSSQRLSLTHGLPESVEDLMAEVKKQCNLQGNIRPHFMDSLFGNEFMNLTSVSEVEDRGTHEVVRDAPMVDDFMARWPALFEVSEINAEFKRITTVPLQSKFLSQLDLHSDNLTRLFQRRGGRLGEKLRRVTMQITNCDDVDAGREWLIKGVCVYMGEDPDNLIQEYVSLDSNTINEAIEDTTVGIYFVKEHASSDDVEDIGIVLEGIKVLKDLANVALAVAMLFGLMYALNLSYPADMEMDGGKLSNEALALKNSLFQRTGHTDITGPFL